jgi:indole-3-glycerol phosphate synthase / phosphoribosylanthranilate isomerase
VRLRDALARPGLSGIAEVKRRSPSAGDLLPDADPGRLAAGFEGAGAAAVSVLVDARFGGSLTDLRAARASASLPLLAKGFFRREEELVAVREAGADAALLILRELDDGAASRLMARAEALGMDSLVEVHDAAELGRAVALGATTIGVNARDLGSFRVDLQAAIDLVAAAPGDRLLVAESGILRRAHAALAEAAGADAILVGTVLMRAAEPAAALRELLARPLVKVCGLTRHEDVAAAEEAGADLAGFVLARSPRRVAEPLPVPDGMLSVAILVGARREAGTDLVQVYPQQNGHRGRDGVVLRGDRVVAAVPDLPWLEEDPGHLDRAASKGGRVMLAGGLSPENVREAIRRVRPWAVDASRSLESTPGIKDAERIRAFVRGARDAAGAVAP